MTAVLHRPSFSLHPLAILAGAFAAGILCAWLFAPPLTFCLFFGLSLSALAAISLARNKSGHATLFVAAGFMSAGAVLAISEGRGIDESRVRRFYEDGRAASGEPVEVTGVLERRPEVAPDGLLMSLRVERFRRGTEEHAATGRIELFASMRDARTRDEYAALELRRGARLRVAVALERDAGFRNPGVSPYTEYLERRETDARGVVKSPLLIERLDDERTFLPLVWLDEWRESLLRGFQQLFSRETAGVLAASLLGNRLHLSRGAAEKFREGGTFHVLVISGLHITFIGGLVWAVTRRLTKRRVWQWAVSCLFVWMYAVGVGAETSVVRAALMFSVVALAPALGRPAVTLNALGGAALMLLVWRPSSLFDPSFQLTFLSVLAIVALAWPVLTRLKEIGEWRPLHATPYPPACPARLRRFAESLFWSERRWRREMSRSTYSYRLFKTRTPARLESWMLQKPLRYAFAALLVSACVQLLMLPLLVLHFHRLSHASLFLNIYVGVAMALLSFVALAALLAAQLSASVAAPFMWLAESANTLMTEGVTPFAAVGVASVRLPEYTGLWASVYALYYLPLAVLILALARWSPLSPPKADDRDEGAARRRRIVKVSAVACAALAALIVAHPLSAGRPDGRLRIDFLDVGQGDAALITMPDGTTLLVDGGGRPRPYLRSVEEGDGEPFERDSRGVGEAVVSEYLWWRGLGKVDYVLATHADTDHIDGLNDVARNFRVGAALVARTPSVDPEFGRFADTLNDASIPLYLVGRGDRLDFGQVEIEVLWPPLQSPGVDAPSQNNHSIVLRIRYGRRAFILTGDIEGEAEAVLVNEHDDLHQDGLHADVVKVAHHGSRTSSTASFVAAITPEFAVISVGRDSPYGHPHTEVVRRWRDGGAQVLTTGARGTITFSTDGEDLRLDTFVRPEAARPVESPP